MASLELEHALSERSWVVVARDQVSADLAGEAVILQLQSGTYYGLDAIGARIWALIQEPCTVQDLCAALLDEYQVEPECCRHELLAFLRELAAHKLIEVRDAPFDQVP